MSQLYQLKISIRDARPPIWRRVIVKPETKLLQLHILIQILFLWKNSHLHRFDLPGNRYNPIPDYSDPVIRENKSCSGLEPSEKLKKLIKEPKKKLIYEYDFGNSWEHIIELEKIVAKEDNKTYPYCVTGKRMAPLDDCGGTSEFKSVLRALKKDETHPRHIKMKKWLLEAFGITDLSSREFNKDALNQKIQDHLQFVSDDVAGPQGNDQTASDDVLEAQDTEEKQYEVEAIIDHRGTDPTKYEYKVRWKGYSPQDDTWEPAESFDQPQSFEIYWRKRRSSNNAINDKAKRARKR